MRKQMVVSNCFSNATTKFINSCFRSDNNSSLHQKPFFSFAVTNCVNNLNFNLQNVM